MTLPQIKSTTGHKSDTVVQGYIDNSMVQKHTSADAISVSGLKKESLSMKIVQQMSIIFLDNV